MHSLPCRGCRSRIAEESGGLQPAGQQCRAFWLFHSCGSQRWFFVVGGDRQAKASGLSLSRYEQDGQGLRIWLDDVSFDDAMTMLEALQSSAGVVANQVNVDKADRPGVVDIRATLSQ